MADDELNIRITADASEVQAAMRQMQEAVQSATRQSASGFQGMSESVKISVQGMSVSIAAGVKVTAAMTQEMNFLRTAAANLPSNVGHAAASVVALTEASIKAGNSVQVVGNELQITSAKAAGAAASSGALGGSLSYLLGRVVGIESGFGNLAFTLGTVARSFGSLSTVMAVGIPIALIAGTIRLIEYFDELAKKAAELTRESLNFRIQSEDTTRALEIENLKLDDQISKLEGRPTTNKLRIALLEAQDAAEKLALSLDKDLDKTFKLLEAGVFDSLIVSGKGLEGVWHDFTSGMDKDTATAVASVKDKVVTAIKDVDAKRAALSVAPPEKSVEATETLRQSYLHLGTVSTQALTRIRELTPDNNEVIHELTNTVVAATSAYKDLGLQQEIAGKKGVVAALTPDRTAGKDAAAEMSAIRATAAADDASLVEQRRTNEISTNEELLFKRVDLENQTYQLELTTLNRSLIATKASTEQSTSARTRLWEEHYRRGESLIKTFYDTEANESRKAQTDDERYETQKRSNQEAELRRQDTLITAQRRLEESKSKATATKATTEVKGEVSLGTITRKEEQESLQAILRQESSELTTAHSKDIAEQNEIISKETIRAESALKGSKDETDALNRVAAAKAKILTLDAQMVTSQQRIDDQIRQSQTEVRKYESTWADFFAKMAAQTRDMARNIRVELQGALNQLTTGFANSVGKMIVEGKSFGQSMLQVFRQVAESLISALVKMLTQWIITHVIMKAIGKTTAADMNSAEAASAAALAAANTLAYMSAIAPPPIPEAAAAVTYGEGMVWAGLAAASGAAEKGAVVPEDMPIFAHAREMVLPAHLSEGVQNIINTHNETRNSVHDTRNLSEAIRTVSANIENSKNIETHHDVTRQARAAWNATQGGMDGGGTAEAGFRVDRIGSDLQVGPVVRSAEAFSVSVPTTSSTIALMHVHPSLGESTPSPADTQSPVPNYILSKDGTFVTNPITQSFSSISNLRMSSVAKPLAASLASTFHTSKDAQLATHHFHKQSHLAALPVVTSYGTFGKGGDHQLEERGIGAPELDDVGRRIIPMHSMPSLQMNPVSLAIKAPASAPGFNVSSSTRETERIIMGSAEKASAQTNHNLTFHTHNSIQALDGASVRDILEGEGDTIGSIAMTRVKSYFRSNGVY